MSPDSGAGNHAPLPTKHNDSHQRDPRTLAARKRLGITPERMRGVPRITHILDRASGGIPTVIAALRTCEDEQVGQFLACYDTISDSDLVRLSVEEICVAANVEPKVILGMAVQALVEDSQSAGKIVAATYHPQVIAATARAALSPWGDKDRKLFLQGTGFLPAPVGRPGGVFVSINNQQANLDAPAVDGVPTSFKPPEDDLKALHESIDGSRMLEAPKEVVGVSATTLGHQYKDEEELECIPSPPSSNG